MTIGLPSEEPNRVPQTGPSRAAIFLAVFSAVFGPSPPETRADGPIEDPQTAYSRLYFGLQPPSDRDTERTVALIEELLEAGRFGEAAPLLEQVFAGPSDYLDPSGRSLKKRLLNAIAQAGDRGLLVVQSVLSGVYERQLGEARSIERLRDLLAQHPPELFGLEGVVAVARLEESRGAYATAAGLWREASDLAAQADDRAIARKYSDAAEVNAMRGGLVPPDNDPRLASAIADARRNRAPLAWLGPGGDSRRQNQAAGGPPIAWRGWRAPIEPALEREYQRGNQGAAGGMVAFEGLLLAPTNAGLVALSADSGKRLWEIHDPGPSSESIEPRYDRLRGGVATDGRLAFVVEPAEPSGDQQLGSPRNRTFGEEPALTLPANTLAAYSLAARGRLRWRFPSETAGKASGSAIPSLSLLGPPAVAESRLYAMAEIDQAICLVSLDAESGRLEWTQPIVRCEQRYPDHAESIGVTPTVSDRLVYCPTGRGAVAAIDPLRRQIEWIHYLQVDKSKTRATRRPAWRGFGRVNWDEDPAAWRHGRLVESGNNLVVVSPALASLEVLNASTGELVWTRELLSENYLAVVDEEQVTTVGSDSVTARDLNRGDEIWSASLPEGDSPAGEPLRVDSGLIVPLDSGRFALVGGSGKIEVIDPGLNPLETSPKLGDLIYHAGAIYSRSGETIECFRQTAPDNLAGEAWRVLSSGGGDDELNELLAALRKHPNDKEAAEFIAACLLKPSRMLSQSPSKPTRSDAAALGRQIQQLVAGPRGHAYAMLLRIKAAEGQEAAALLADLRRSPAANEVLSPESGHWATAECLALAAAGSSVMEFQTASQSPEAPPGSGTPIDYGDWSKHQIQADVDVQRSPPGAVNFSSSSRRRRNRREPAALSRALSFSPTGLGRTPSHLWRVESNNGENAVLVGANRWGERLITTPITSAWTNRSLGSGSTVGLPADGYWNGWIGLRLEDGFAVYRLGHTEGETDGNTNEANQAELAWESTAVTSPGFPESVSGSIAEQLHAVGPWGTLSVAGNDVLCRDLITGGLRWRRQIEIDGGERLRLLVDRQQVLVAGRGNRGIRISAVSGEVQEDESPIAATRLWRAYAPARSPDEPGRLLIEERTITGREYRLQTTDDSETPLWRAEAKATSLTTVTSDGLFAMLTLEGQFTLVDLRAGVERFSIKLPGTGTQPVRAIRLHEHAKRLLVEVDRTNPMIDRHRGFAGVGSQPLLTGELYCLDPQTGGSRWAGQAEVSALCLMPSPVHDAPVLLLARSQRDGQTKEGSPDLSLVVLDLATGGTIYSNYDIPARDSNFPAAFWVKAESLDSAAGPAPSGKASSGAGIGTLTVRLGSAWITLQPTDQPAMPRPPMLARVEDPVASKAKGTKAMGERVEGLFKSLFPD